MASVCVVFARQFESFARIRIVFAVRACECVCVCVCVRVLGLFIVRGQVCA